MIPGFVDMIARNVIIRMKLATASSYFAGMQIDL